MFSMAKRRASRVGRRSMPLGAALVVGAASIVGAVSDVSPQVANAAVLDFNEPFTGTTLNHPNDWSVSYAETAEWIMVNDALSPPCLTARAPGSGSISLGSGQMSGCGDLGTPETDGDGALRLIRDLAPTDKTQAAAMIYTVPQSTIDGLDIRFKMALWDETLTADGMTFFLKDGADPVDTPGAPGGSLGYSSSSIANGLSGALLGIGFDKYGNFSTADSSCAGETGSATKDSIVVRGPGTGTTGYCRIGRSTDASYFTGATRTAAARQVRIVIEPASDATPKVQVFISAVGVTPTTPVIEIDAPQALLDAATFKFGFGAASGWYKINAAVWDLSIDPAAADPTATVTAPSGSMTYGVTPPALGSATALEDGTTTPALTFDTAPTCEIFESASAGNTIAGPPTPIVLSSTTPAGTYVVACEGGSISGYSLNTYVDGTFTVLPATTTVTYTGATMLSSGSAALSATVVSPCAEGSTVEFTITPNAVPAGPYTATVTGGVASTPTLTLTQGTVYSVGVSSAGDGNCDPDSDSATLTTTAPGVSTNGVGSYVVGATTLKYSHQVTSSVKTNAKARTRTTTYRGSVTWEVPGQTRLVGTVASTLLQSLDGTPTAGSAAWVTFSCPELAPTSSSGGSSSPKPSGPVCGSFSGIGTLQPWDPALNKGRGGWSTNNGVSVAFQVTVFDAGSVCGPVPTSGGKKKQPCKLTELPGDAFGILIGGTGPTDVVESGPTPISTGYIRSVA